MLFVTIIFMIDFTLDESVYYLSLFIISFFDECVYYLWFLPGAEAAAAAAMAMQFSPVKKRIKENTPPSSIGGQPVITQAEQLPTVGSVPLLRGWDGGGTVSRILGVPRRGWALGP